MAARRVLPASGRRRAQALGVALALAWVGTAACSRSEAPAPAPSASAPVLDDTPVPVPPGHLADLTLAAPEVTWRALRDMLGGPAALLPSSFGLVAGTALGLDAAAAAELSGDVPVVGALTAEGEALGVVLGVHVRSGAELEARLTRGADAKWAAERDAASGIVLLTSKGGVARDLVLGVRGNYLVAASSRAALLGTGPYVVRTLARRPPPAAGAPAFSLDAPESALAGELAKRLRTRWKDVSTSLAAADLLKRSASGRAPDFGEPAAAMAAAGTRIEALAAVLESSRSFRLTAAPAGGRLDVRARVEPKGGAAAELTRTLSVGKPEALGRLPASTLVGLWSRSTQVERGEGAAALLDGLTSLFGERFAERDRKEVGKWLSSLALGRGDEGTLGLVMDGREGVILARTPVADGKALDAALRGLLGAHKIKAFAEPLERHLGKPTVKLGGAKLEGLGKVTRASVTLKRPADPPGSEAPPPRTVQVYWVEHGGELFLVAGEKPEALLQRVIGAGPALAGDPEFVRLLEGFGSGVALAMVVRVGVLLPAGNAPGLPSVVAAGSGDGGLWARADLGRDLLGLLSRALFRGGF